MLSTGKSPAPVVEEPAEKAPAAEVSAKAAPAAKAATKPIKSSPKKPTKKGNIVHRNVSLGTGKQLLA